MRWDAILLILYGIAIIFIILQFANLWSLSLILMIILLISLIQKIYFDKEFRKSTTPIIELISQKIDSIVAGIEDLRNQEKASREETKITLMSDFENIFSDIRKRVVDVESKLIDIKENIDIYQDGIERRIRNLENIVSPIQEDN